MRPRKLRRIFLLMLFGAILAGSALGYGMGRARADITPAAKEWADDGGAILVCKTLNDFGVTESILDATVATIEKKAGLDNYNAAGVLVYAVHDYCPVFWYQLGQVVDRSSQQQPQEHPPVEQRKFGI